VSTARSESHCLLSLRVPCRGVALFPRELAKILEQLRRLRDPNRPRALDAIEAALLAIGLAELAERQQQTIEELSRKLWQTQQELAHYKASVRFQLAAEDMWRTADHISEWERELRD
jgi:recombinational DNA repair ATPase RecF